MSPRRAKKCLGALLLSCLTWCQPPAPAVDEERLARRVAELLAERISEEGACAPRREGEPSEDEDAARLAEQERRQRAAVDSMRAQMAALAREAQSAIPESPLPIVQLSPEHRASASGAGASERTCIPLLTELPVLGPEQAAVTIVAFIDPECPFCARLFPLVVRAQRAYPRDVRVAFALAPLPFHRNAPRASRAAFEALAQQRVDGFVRVLSRMFANTRELGNEAILAHAEAEQLDVDRMRAVLASDTHAPSVATALALATSARVGGFPTIFINGRRVSGAVPEETIGGLLAEELARAQRLRRSTPAARLQSALCRSDGSNAGPTPARPLPLPGPSSAASATSNGDQP